MAEHVRGQQIDSPIPARDTRAATQKADARSNAARTADKEISLDNLK